MPYRGELCPFPREGEVTRGVAEGESKGPGVCHEATTFELPMEDGRVQKAQQKKWELSWEKQWPGRGAEGLQRASRRKWPGGPARIPVCRSCLLNFTQILKIINWMLWG